MDSWKDWPKVSPARSGGANTKRYTGKRVEATRVAGECWWCSRPATRLCDTLLIPTGEKLFTADGCTCDAEVCEECSVSSTIFFAHDCGLFDDKGEPIGRTETDTRDQCPYCQAHAGQRGSHRRGGVWSEQMMVKANLWRERVAAHAAKTKRPRASLW